MRFPRLAALSAASLLAGVFFVTGCGSDSDSGGNPAVKAEKPKTGTLEELAAMATCKPDIQVDADELRQGVCRTAAGSYVLTTFSTAKGQQEWLEEAKPYGGSYLVGTKWIAVGTPEVLGTLRAKLGGRVEMGSQHSGGATGGGQHGTGHGSGHGGGH